MSGLSGTVVLQDNGGDNLSVTANGSFTFPTRWRRRGVRGDGEDQPGRAGLHGLRRVGDGGSANVTSVAVTCANLPSYSVGGTVSGLSGTVVLQDNGGDNLRVTANGSFTFATSVAAARPTP